MLDLILHHFCQNIRYNSQTLQENNQANGFFYVNETLKRYSAKTSYLTSLQPQSVLFQEAWTLQGNLKNAYLKIVEKYAPF